MSSFKKSSGRASDFEIFLQVRALCYQQGLVSTVKGYDPLLSKEDIDQIIWLSIQEAKQKFSPLKSLKVHTNRHKHKRKSPDLKSVAFIYARKNLFQAVNACKDEIERHVIVDGECKRISEKTYLAAKKKYNGNGFQVKSTRIVKSMEDLIFEDFNRNPDEILEVDDIEGEIFCENNLNPEEMIIKKETIAEEDIFEI